MVVKGSLLHLNHTFILHMPHITPFILRVCDVPSLVSVHLLTCLLCLPVLHVQPQLPSADSVEYWRSPEKAGWMQCQGEITKTWRKRWFVLKQGYLFRFLNADVSGERGRRGKGGEG